MTVIVMPEEKYMKLTDLFLDQLEKETESTRRTLERVPEGRNDWKPHEKSMLLGYLASLVAGMPGWISFMVNQDELDINSPAGVTFRPPIVSTRRELVQLLDESVAKAREALRNTTDEHLMTNWKFIVGGHRVSDLPRYVMIRDAVLSHLAHHRGQLTVYLRLNDAPVPSIYGPSADEKVF
jgi:uncharacterized damage-inducible protein DinB